MRRIHQQYCLCVNPFNRHQVTQVSLQPEDVDALVFWTKNAEPLLSRLPELDARGYRYYFQYTLNGYGELFEPNLPELERCIETFLQLSERIGAGAVAMVPVAAPDHPLGRMERIAPGAGRDYTQLVLSDRSAFTDGRDYAVISPKTWRLADLGAKHALLREGIGWGNMPLPMIEADLVAGTLVRLAMPDFPGSRYRFLGIWRRDCPPGPAASWLLDQFAACGRDDPVLPDAEDGSAELPDRTHGH